MADNVTVLAATLSRAAVNGKSTSAQNAVRFSTANQFIAEHCAVVVRLRTVDVDRVFTFIDEQSVIPPSFVLVGDKHLDLLYPIKREDTALRQPVPDSLRARQMRRNIADRLIEIFAPFSPDRQMTRHMAPFITLAAGRAFAASLRTDHTLPDLAERMYIKVSEPRPPRQLRDREASDRQLRNRCDTLLRELGVLNALRGGDHGGTEPRFLFYAGWYAKWLAYFKSGDWRLASAEARQVIADFNATFTEPLTKRQLSTALRSSPGRLHRNETVADAVIVTAEEFLEGGFAMLVPPEIAARRRESRAQKLQAAAERRQLRDELLRRGASTPEVIAQTGYSRSTVQKAKARIRAGPSDFIRDNRKERTHPGPTSATTSANPARSPAPAMRRPHITSDHKARVTNAP